MVTSAIQDMPPKQYLALYLYAVEGLGHIEIAGELGVSESLSKKLVQRAREYLLSKGLDERTFFAVPPPMVEVHARSEGRSSGWREFYDWTYRIGHFASLVAATAAVCAAHEPPVEFARAGLPVPKITTLHVDRTSDSDEPERPVIEEPPPAKVVPARRADKPSSTTDKPSSTNVWVNPQGHMFHPRKTR